MGCMHSFVLSLLQCADKTRFLWVVLQLEDLFGRNDSGDGICQTAQDVRRNITHMPQGLEATYRKCLCRQSSTQARYTAQILRWVCASPEPTHIDNVRELLAFDPETRLLKQDAILPKGNLLRAATNLIVLESSDQSTGPEAASRRFLLPVHCTVRAFVFSPAGQDALNQMDADTRYWTQSDTLLELGGICAAYLLAFSGRELAVGVTAQVPSAPMLRRVYDVSLSSSVALLASKAVSWRFNASVKHQSTLRRPRQPKEEIEVRLIDFARRNWHICLRHVKKDSQPYNDFKALVFEHADALHRPWAQSRKTSSSTQIESLLFWTLSNDHAALLDFALEVAVQQKVFPTDFWTEPLAACKGVPLLHFAVKRCNEAIVTRLLPYCSADSSYQRCTALHCAVESANLDVVLLLLSYVEGHSSPYRKVLAKDSNGRTVLHLAAMRDKVDICQVLCDASKPLLERGNDRHKSLLASGNVKQYLLDHAKCSPLYYAILTEDLAMIDIITAAQIVIEPDVTRGGTLAMVQEVVSLETIAHVFRRLAQEHGQLTRLSFSDLEMEASDFGLSEVFMEEFISSTAADDILCGDLGLSEEFLEKIEAIRSSRHLSQERKNLAHRLCPELAEEANDIGLFEEFSQLVGLTTASYGGLSGNVGLPQEFVNKVIGTAARDGLLETVKLCSTRSSLKGEWQAMITAVTVENDEVFEWIRADLNEKMTALARTPGSNMIMVDLGTPSSITFTAIASHSLGFLVIPFLEDGTIVETFNAPRPKRLTGFGQVVTLYVDVEVGITMKTRSKSIRLHLVQLEALGTMEGGSISVRGAQRNSFTSYYESDNGWTLSPHKAHITSSPIPQALQFTSTTSFDRWDVEHYQTRSWVLGTTLTKATDMKDNLEINSIKRGLAATAK